MIIVCFQKLSSIVTLKNLRKVPGPGAYDPQTTLNKTGKYFISKFHNSLAATWNPPGSKRFNDGGRKYSI
jgi:hypothetical protein